ncbi:MAG: polyprenyl synthetase family protein [Clostridia bacterium]|nr:polyprenyl synthetase family protein [Clostridia bacterium]
MKQELDMLTQKINTALNEYVGAKNNLQKEIYEIMSYALMAGGKRLRPVLMMSVCKMCGGDYNEILPYACAMEMIHTYSLVHDDLPSMDNDELRRGKPTCHIKYGEANAILAGDALLNKAFEVMSQSGAKHPEKALKIMSVIAKSSGTDGMIGGQVLDIENGEMSQERLEYIDSLKTGAIIRSSCVAGAIFADATDVEIKAVDEYARHLGIAFQICDDILDVTGNTEDLGKPVGSDSEMERTTYVKSFGIDGAKALLEEHTQKALNSLSIFGKKADFLKELTQYLARRTN